MRWIFFLLLLVNAIGFGWWMHGFLFSAPSRVSASAEAGVALLPAGAERLLLIREADPTELVPRSPPPRRSTNPTAASKPRPAPVTGSNKAPLPAVPPRVCYRLGPFPGKDVKKTQIDAVRTWLDARRISVKLHRNQRREVRLHWVYLPPFKTIDEAKKQAARMKKKGVRDIFLLRRGDMKNAISLGVFSQRASMGKRLDELKRRGFAATVGSRYGTKKATWFTVAPPAGATFPKSDFSRRFPSLEVAAEDCN
uniref:Sporulation related domain-containing protein n=1 Tax=Candidatus Kentrum sp. DK TaxID=2126562 RepID=A0A450SJN5_9GAMM|nr:MAG: hypothetical protein BECKDK2373C_GA0170839_10401 [Candidatus Kentron sp. DK]VFJ57410.1 MAG: hypothetical protein BECKDK2373B_GA0170837_10667 [Candidatus Kentron sp. DK]